MARGKPKAKFPEEYPSEDEDAKAEREARAKAPQAKPHKRGGVHKVKKEHLTGTKWDKMTLNEVKSAALRDPKYKPFFARFKKPKDLKKHVFAQTLADADKELDRRAQKAKRESAKLREQARIKALELEREKRAQGQKKQEERLRKEEEGQILSDEDESIEERPQVYLQQEESDTSDTTSTRLSELPIDAPQHLRMFEWSFTEPPSGDYGNTARRWPRNEELQPRELPYTPMNVVTMRSREMLHTPGINAQETGIEPDRVPPLSPHVKDCARNGVLTGPLEGAVVESGQYWRARTIIQAWNGRMYFNLPRPDEDLAEAYRKWKSRDAYKKRRANRQLLREAGVHKRGARFDALKKQEQRRLIKNVYRASQWRPTLAYLPAYLPYSWQAQHDGPPGVPGDRDLEDLFYIRLKGESVPSFFFWVEASKGGWIPTKPNPQYDEYSGPQRVLKPDRRLSRLVRVKRVPSPSRFKSRNVNLTSTFDVALWTIERNLYYHGLGDTLKLYHDKWQIEGREDAWRSLTSLLKHQLPPSGRWPSHPPVRPERDPYMISIAEKMARVEDLGPNSRDPILPIYIDDDWTRNDDAYWTTKERLNSPEQYNIGLGIQYATPISRAGRPASGSHVPTPRPSTPDTPHSLHRSISDVFAWVSTVSTPGTPFYDHPNPAATQHIQQGKNLALQIMAGNVDDKPFQPDMFRTLNSRWEYQKDEPGRCGICSEIFDFAETEEGVDEMEQ